MGEREEGEEVGVWRILLLLDLKEGDCRRWRRRETREREKRERGRIFY
jgi:hypothetical protein